VRVLVPLWEFNQGRRLAFVIVGFGALDAAHRVVADRVKFAEVVEERGHRRQLAPDGTGRQAAALEVFSSSDEVGAGDLPHFLRALDAREGREFFHVTAVGAPGAWVVQVGVAGGKPR
jgi:hypothetical protein